ncbi:MAG TPA: hypothetical protein DEA32_03340 [Firmicutes bacterium]|nr:hypothetical protein [Bacillota bacterium]
MLESDADDSESRVDSTLDEDWDEAWLESGEEPKISSIMSHDPKERVKTENRANRDCVFLIFLSSKHR